MSECLNWHLVDFQGRDCAEFLFSHLWGAGALLIALVCNVDWASESPVQLLGITNVWVSQQSF